MTEPATIPAVWGIIPAAGASRRMGRPKQSLAYRGSTMTGTVVRTLLSAGVTGIVLVTRSRLVEGLALPEDPRVHVAFNDNADTEMIDSIRIGLSAVEGLGADRADGVLVVPADMPGLSSQSCASCMDAYRAEPDRIVVAAHQGHRGHPIIFPLAQKKAVDDLSGGLNMLLHDRPELVRLVETGDPDVTADVDTPDDYGRLETRD